MGLHVALVFIYFPLAICNLALGRPADPTEHSPRPSPIYLSGNATTTTSSLATEEGIGTQSGGCVFFSTGSDGIPVGASGSTTLPPYTSGGPSQTVPCAKIVQYYREKHLNSSKSSSTAPPSLTGDDPLQSRPTFRAPDLTGCYAGTGGSTVYTAFDGNYLPANYAPSGVPRPSQTGEYVSYSAASKGQVLTMNCTDYMTMPLARGSDVIKFQQDPVCTSYLDWDKSHPKVPNGIGYDPPGVYNMAGVVDWDCCGGCVLYAPAISILYFSTTPAPSCPGKTGTITSPPVSPTAIHKRGVNAMNSIEGSPEFAVYDNTTLTFPSIYLAVNGIMSVRDQCGWVGSNYTSALIPVQPGGLSTLSFSKFFNIANGATTGAFDPALPMSCWTYGAGEPVVSSRLLAEEYNPSVSTWDTTTFYTEGSPYWPFIVPPVEMTEFDPVWKKSCRFWHTAGDPHFALNFGVFDPPRMLTPVAAGASPPTAMADSTTQHASWGAPTPSARPGSASKPDSPRVTSNVPNAGDPTGNAPLDPALPNDPKQGGVGGSSPVINPPAGPIGNGNSGNGGKTQSDPGNAGKEDQGPKSPAEGSTENLPGDPSAHNPDPADPLQNPVDSRPNSVPGFEISKSLVGVNTNPIYHVGSQTLVPGGPAVTINNVPYALAPSGNAIAAGTKTVPIQPPPAGTLPDIQIEGKTYQANKNSQYIVGDQTLRPNGPPAVIDHVTYSIAPSASAIVSSGHTVTLAPSRQDPAAVIIDNQSFSQDTRPRITIHGQEIVAGGPSITIDHTPYALASAGDTLIAGTSAIPLETHAVPQRGGNPTSPNNNSHNDNAGSNDMALIIKNPGSGAASTIPIPHPSSPDQYAENAENAVLTIAGKTYTADSSSRFIIGSQTLTPGSPAITVAGTSYSLRSTPQSIPPKQQQTSSPSTQTTPTPYAIFTLKNSTYTCTRNQNCTIASQTLTPNGTITVGDQTVVYGTNGIDVVKPQTKSAGESRGKVITSHISGLTPLEEATRTAAGTGAAEPTGETGKKSDADAILREAGAEGVMGLWVVAIVAAMVV